MRIFFITEKMWVYESFNNILEETGLINNIDVDYFHSADDIESDEEFKSIADKNKVKGIDLKCMNEEFYGMYDMFFSWHCRQIFPDALVNNHRCINVHPSFIPYNKGWYPQIFCMINGLPAGVTIHEMDSNIDTGEIICQVEVEKKKTDTGLDLYNRIVRAEIKIVKDNIKDILSHNYLLKHNKDGNINYKKDFMSLCEINMEKEATYGQVINYLRALTFGNYKNAFFYDDDGKKIWVTVNLIKEE